VRNCTASCAAGYCCAGALGNSMACFEGGSAACPDTMPPMKQGLGERCGDASECQSDLCLEQPGEPGYLFCSADCSASMPCGGAAGQFTCADAGGGRSVCIYAGTPPGGLGTACTAGDGCASGMCLPLAGGSQCSTLCTDTMPCPGGFDCIPTAGVEKVCQKQAPPPGGGDGGCQTSGSSGRAGTLAGVMMLLAALVLVSRRRS